MRRLQYQLKTTVVTVFVCAVALCAITFVCRVYRNTQQSVVNYYAISQVTDMLIHHMHESHGVPPKNWADLEAAYQYVDTGYNTFSFRELRAIVGIDFDRLAAGMNTLNENVNHQKGARVIFLNKGGQVKIVEVEANDRLWERLKERPPRRNLWVD